MKGEVAVAKRIRKNYFKAGKLYWVVIAPFVRDGSPNIYMETWTIHGTWTVNTTSRDEPRVYHTKSEAESAAVLLAGRFPEKVGRLEVMQYSRDQDFEQVVP